MLEIREVCRRLLARGLPVDSFAPRIAILVNCRMDLFEEIAKIRATRRMFARMMREEFGATDPRSWSVNIAVHTSGLTLTAAQPANNIVRGAVQALAMAMAGVQGLEISAFDEPFRTPSAIAHQTAIRTQQVIQTETNITAVEDPLGGSWYLESLTDELERRIDAAVRQMEALGDVGTLVESGYFRNIFLHGMDRHSRAVQSGDLRIVGVNEHVIAARGRPVPARHSRAAVRAGLRARRVHPRLAPHPRRRAAASRPGAGPRGIGRPRRRPHGPDRGRPRRGRHHRRDHRLPPGGPGAARRPVRVRRPAPAARDPDMTGPAPGPAPGPAGGSGRPGRVVIGTLGLDQHEVGAMAISRILIRHGYEVIYLGRFNTPERLTAAAEQEDANLVGVSIHSWEYTAYADELLARCRELGIGLVLGGSVLTERDQADLLGRGADAVFGPYASEATMLAQIDAVVRRVRAGEPPAQSHGTQPGRPVPLAGRTVIVTGAARGLGRAYTLELCRQGAAVVADDIDEAALKEVADAARDLPGSVHAVVCDVTGPDAPRTLLDAALRRYGQLHGLVSNAGLLRSGPILQLDDSDLRLLLDVHVTAPFRLLRAAGRYWRAEAKAGREVEAAVVLTTSSAGLYGFRAEAAYSAAKAAVAMLTRVGADELGRYGATVNAVAPVARTRLTEWLGEAPASPGAGPGDDPLAAEHVAPVIAWLLGPAARTVTGRVLEAGNGQISAPSAWQPGPQFPLPALMSPEAADVLLPRVLASAAPPPEVLSSQS